MGSQFYEDYLKSPAWREKRKEVLARSGGYCEQCCTAKARHVHHKTYDRLGNEDLDDLEALCIPCHASKHPHMRKNGDQGELVLYEPPIKCQIEGCGRRFAGWLAHDWHVLSGHHIETDEIRERFRARRDIKKANAQLRQDRKVF